MAGLPARRSVLLVDDEPAVRRWLQRAMERAGYEVLCAGSLLEACAVADAAVLDGAVLDLNLADGHGLQLVEALRESSPRCRIVVLTGYDSIASSVLALRSGVAAYLAKPVGEAALLAALAGKPEPEPLPSAQPMSPDRVRWEHVQRLFEQCERNVSETARRLGMHRRTLQRILAKRAPR
jgi:two-component system response regulator RegA